MIRQLTSLALVAALGAAPARARALDLELAAHGGGSTRTQENDTFAPPAPVVGLTSLARLSEPIALGLLLEYGRWNWTAAARGGGGESALDTLLVAPALRWYPLPSAALLPHLQLALGYGTDSGTIRSGDGRCDMQLGALRGQLALGADLPLAAWARLGASASTTVTSYSQSCNDIYTGRRRVEVAPGWMLSGQLAFTALWDEVL